MVGERTDFKEPQIRQHSCSQYASRWADGSVQKELEVQGLGTFCEMEDGALARRGFHSKRENVLNVCGELEKI